MDRWTAMMAVDSVAAVVVMAAVTCSLIVMVSSRQKTDRNQRKQSCRSQSQELWLEQSAILYT